jgi:DNA processing protein
MREKDLAVFVLLNRIPFCDAKRVQLLTGSLEAISDLLRDEILLFMENKSSFGARLVRAIREMRKSFNPEDEIARAQKNNISLIPFSDPRYPTDLLEIHDAPVLLYVAGNVELLHNCAVAVVGSRTASFYGREMARDISAFLAAQGLTIVSGMARGVDAEAHAAALSVGGYTAAVLGSGVDVLYPRDNKKIYEEINEKGVLVSEYPLGTHPYPHNFPKRNRIISGLVRGVVVVEAAQKSGSLITARAALDEGRDVFCVPGNANSIRSQGTNNLIKEGAKLVTSGEEVLEYLFPEDSLSVVRHLSQKKTPLELPFHSESEHNVIEFLTKAPTTFDVLLQKTKYDSSELFSLLANLEVRHVIKREYSGGYVRA